MNNKKGFIFVETIIVTAILLASLMVIYSLFTASYSQENKKTRYDDTSKIYELYYLKRYFQNFYLEEAKQSLRNDETKYYKLITCANNYMSSEDKDMCDKMIVGLRIQQLLLIDESKIDDIISCANETTCTKDFLSNNTSLITYLKSIDFNPNSTDKYYLIAEFGETESGGKCEESKPNECFVSYAYVDISIRLSEYFSIFKLNNMIQ